MTATVTYRLTGVSKPVHERFDGLFDHLAYLYREGVDLDRDRYFDEGANMSFFDLCKELAILRQSYPKNEGWAKYGSTNQRSVLKRIYNAKRSFFSNRKKGLKAGPPRRNKRIRSFEGMTCPRKVKAKYRLKIKGVGTVRFKDDRNVLDNPDWRFRMYRIVRHHLGTGYDIQLVVDYIGDKPPAPDTRAVVGIDFGWTYVMTLSNGTQYKSQERLDGRVRRLNRKLARAKRGSRSSQKVKTSLRKEHQRVTTQRKQQAHRITTDVIKNHSANLVLEDLRTEKLTRKGGNYKRGFNRKGRDNAIAMHKSMLTYKAERANGLVELINPRNTTRVCSDCSGLQDMSLSDRTYICGVCGMVKDRDHNAALTIRSRGLSAFAGRGFPLCVGPDGLTDVRPTETTVDVGNPTTQDNVFIHLST